MQETQVWYLGWEDSPGEQNGNSLQYSCLKNPMDRRAWWPTVHGVAKRWAWLKQLSMHTCIIEFLFLFPFFGFNFLKNRNRHSLLFHLKLKKKKDCYFLKLWIVRSCLGLLTTLPMKALSPHPVSLARQHLLSRTPLCLATHPHLHHSGLTEHSLKALRETHNQRINKYLRKKRFWKVNSINTEIKNQTRSVLYF